MKQDYNGVRTAEDLERKYNLSSIALNAEETKKNKEGLESLGTDLKIFSDQVTKDIGDLQNQLDGNITSWFENGVPTLNNFPANEWTTDDLKAEHIGDLYYDQDTGYSYRFVFKDTYKWIKITDSDVTKALAIANAAQDTADQKRRVFVVQPKPPYDNGDMWIKDKEIWICQVSKQEGIFEDRDFINELKYTDDTKANEVDGKLTIVKGQVTTIIDNVDKLQKTMVSTVDLVDSQGKKIGNLETKQSEITQTVEGINTKVADNKRIIDNQTGKITALETGQSEINQTVGGLEISVTESKQDIESTNSTISKVQEKITAQDKTLEIISTNIDKSTGEIREVTTTNGFTFNSKGLNIYTDQNSYNTQIDNVGTYYRDGSNVVSQTTKDGSLLKNPAFEGQTQFANNGIGFDFLGERINIEGEDAYAIFYNGEE